MKTKRFRLLTVLMAAAMCAVFHLNVFAAQSDAVTQNGLTAQLFTDKDAYEAGESVNAAVRVDNHTGKAVFISTSVKVPEGVMLAGESAVYDSILADGGIWTTPGGTAVEGAAVSGMGTVATGDNLDMGAWTILAALAVGGIFVVLRYGRNKKSVLSIMLCMAMVSGLLSFALPAQAAAVSGSIGLSCTIQVDGKDAEVTATVSYYLIDEEESSDEETAETGESAGETGEGSGETGESSGESGESSGETGESSGESGEGAGESGEGSGGTGEGSGETGEGSGESGEATVVSYPIVAVTAIGDDGNKPENSYDGDYSTRWSFEGKGSWITYDLGEVRNVGYMGIAFYLGDERISAFDVEASVDGETFFPVATSVSSELTLDMMGIDFGGTDARYIKVIGNGNTQGLWNSITEVGFYPVHESGEMVLPEREEPESVEVSAEILAAIDDLKTIYGEDVIDFLANLYDPATGAFYYAVSARDTVGYLPDLESTAQLLTMLNSFVESGKTIADYMTEESIDKLVSWTQNLQDEEDGYFYHPQWGKDILDSRRGRDLSWAVAILTRFNAEPLYPTALDRLSGTTASTAVGGSSLPSYLLSEDAFRNWISNLPWGTNPYSAGNSVNAAAAQIHAAGYTDIAVEYLNSIQNTETGLWGEGLNYETVSAAMKVAIIYQNAVTNINNAEKTIDSIIEVALGDVAPQQITFIYNPWSAISQIRTIFEKSGEVPQWFTDALYENAPEMIKKTKEKLLVFKKDDGGFSYFPGMSASTSQGAPASLGLAEGDVNATSIAINGCLRNIYLGLGMKNQPVYDADDVVRFMEILRTVKPPVKNEVKAEGEFDFEDGLPETVKSTLTNGSVSVVADPANSDNQVLAFTTAAGAGETVSIDLPDSEAGESVTVTFKLMLKDFGDEQYTTISLMGSGSYAYQMLARTRENGAKVWFGDRRWSAAPAADMKFFKQDASQETWYNFKVVYTPPADGEELNMKVYIEDILVQESARFYYKNANMEGEAKSSIGELRFSSMSSAAGTLYIDDVKIADTEEGSASGGEPGGESGGESGSESGGENGGESGDGSGGESGGDPVVSGGDAEVSGGDAVTPVMTMDFEGESIPGDVTSTLSGGSVSLATDPANAANKVLAFTTAAGGGESVNISLPDPEAGESITVTYKLMLKDFAEADMYSTMALYSSNSIAYQMLARTRENGCVWFGDRRWSAAPAADMKMFEQNAAQDTWYDFKVVYTPPVDGAEVNIKVYIDDVLVQESARFYYKSVNMDGEAKSFIDGLRFSSMSSTAGTLYIDDITVSK